MSDLPRLPRRERDEHKGGLGTCLVVGGSAGSPRMVGAPALAALAALRAGAGLVKVLAPEPIIDGVIQIAPGATGLPLPVDGDRNIRGSEAAEILDMAVEAGARALAVGPGFGGHENAGAATFHAIQQDRVPVVLDADALNALARTPDFTKDLRAAAVLTPHPGEFRRLAEALGLKLDPVSPEARAEAAERLALRVGCVVVLKGAGTVVSNGLETWVCDRGHPCLATPGSGDVLTGLIAGMVCQFVPDAVPAAVARVMPADPRRPLSLYDAARVAVEVHAVAGEVWAERSRAGGGLLAEELPALLPEVIERYRSPAGG